MEDESQPADTPYYGGEITPPRNTPQLDVLQSSAKRVRQLSEDLSTYKRARISPIHLTPRFRTGAIPSSNDPPSIEPGLSVDPGPPTSESHKTPAALTESDAYATADILRRMRDYVRSIRNIEQQNRGSSQRARRQVPPSISPPVLQPSPHIDESTSNEFSIHVAPDLLKSMRAGTSQRLLHPRARPFPRNDRMSDENPAYSRVSGIVPRNTASQGSSQYSITPPRLQRPPPMSQSSSSSKSPAGAAVPQEAKHPHKDNFESLFRPIASQPPVMPSSSTPTLTPSKVEWSKKPAPAPAAQERGSLKAYSSDWSLDDWTALKAAMADVVSFDVEPTHAVDHVMTRLPSHLRQTPRRQLVNRMRALLIWNQRRSLSKR